MRRDLGGGGSGGYLEGTDRDHQYPMSSTRRPLNIERESPNGYNSWDRYCPTFLAKKRPVSRLVTRPHKRPIRGRQNMWRQGIKRKKTETVVDDVERLAGQYYVLQTSGTYCLVAT